MKSGWGRYVLAGGVLVLLAPAAWRIGSARWVEYRWKAANERAHEISQAGRPADALIERQQAFEAAKQFGEADPRYRASVRDLSDTFADRQQISDAYGLELILLQMAVREHGSNSPEAAAQLERMAQLRMKGQQPAEAKALLGQALAIWQTIDQGEDPRVIGTLRALIDTLEMLNAPAEAEPYYEWSLGLQRRALGNDHPDLAPFELEYADLLEKLGKIDLATRFREHAAQIRKTASPTPAS